MSFRQGKTNRRQRSLDWQAWLARWSPALTAAGLPPPVLLSADHWADFLANGGLDKHPEADTGFHFGQLSADQMAGLLAVLEQMPGWDVEQLAGYLRFRLG